MHERLVSEGGRGKRWKSLAPGLVLLSLVCVVLAAPQVYADVSGDYAWSDTACNTNRSDPVGAVFHGSNAAPMTVYRNIIQHAGWNYWYPNPYMGLQTYVDTSQTHCTSDEAGNKSPPIDCPALDTNLGCDYHIRLWKTKLPAENVKTVGTPHEEEIHLCNDTIVGNNETADGRSGFDRARQKLRDKFAQAGHDYNITYWGNSDRRPQCDGDVANSSGDVVHIVVNHDH